MSTNISGGVELGGLLTIEHLQGKNKNKPVKGQKLSALKDAVTLKKKSADGSSDAGEVKLLRGVDEEPQVDRESVKAEARVQVASVKTAVKIARAATREDAAIKTATREDLYAGLTKKGAAGNAAYEVDGVRFSAEEMKSMREAQGDVFATMKQVGSGLVYSDYAKMGIAENVVRSYAEKNLSGEQADVIMEDEVQSFFKQYQDWMKPAYMEVNGRAEAAEEHIVADIALYKRQYKDLTARVLAASVPHINMQI